MQKPSERHKLTSENI